MFHIHTEQLVKQLWALTFPQQWRYRSSSSGLWHCVVWQ